MSYTHVLENSIYSEFDECWKQAQILGFSMYTYYIHPYWEYEKFLKINFCAVEKWNFETNINATQLTSNWIECVAMNHIISSLVDSVSGEFIFHRLVRDLLDIWTWTPNAKPFRQVYLCLFARLHLCLCRISNFEFPHRKWFPAQSFYASCGASKHYRGIFLAVDEHGRY